MGLAGTVPALEHQHRAAVLAGWCSHCCAVPPAVIQPGWGWVPARRTLSDALPAVTHTTALPGDISQ